MWLPTHFSTGCTIVLTRRRFLGISAFRVWHDSPPASLGEGLASRFGDELVKLHRDVREHGRSTGPEFHRIEVEPPAPAQVTIEYKGVSLDAFNAFLRCLFRRQTLITGDLLPPRGELLLLVARAGRFGPWEVEAPNNYGPGLDQSLRELAVRASVDLQPVARKAIANSLAFRQIEAYKRSDHDEALRLAKLGLIAVPNHQLQFYNLAQAYAKKHLWEQSLEASDKALDIDPEYVDALFNRGAAYAGLGKLKEAISDFEKAHKLKPDDKEIYQQLEKLKEIKRIHDQKRNLTIVDTSDDEPT